MYVSEVSFLASPAVYYCVRLQLSSSSRLKYQEVKSGSVITILYCMYIQVSRSIYVLYFCNKL